MNVERRRVAHRDRAARCRERGGSRRGTDRQCTRVGLRTRTGHRVGVDHGRAADAERAHTGHGVRRPVTKDRTPRHAQIIIAANNRTVEADLRTAQRHIGAERDFTRVSLVTAPTYRAGVDRRRAADTQCAQPGHGVRRAISKDRIPGHTEVAGISNNRILKRDRRTGERCIGAERNGARISLGSSAADRGRIDRRRPADTQRA